MTSVCHATGDVHFDHLSKVVFARFLQYEIIVFPFTIDKCFVGKDFEPV